jgi:hypothetical protein
MVSAIDILKTLNGVESLINIRCASHILNISVKDGFKYCKKVHSSTTLVQELKIQKQLHRENLIFFVLDVDTRWNSTHNMLKTALIIKTIFVSNRRNFGRIKSSTKTIINNAEWDDVVKIVDLLEPFYQYDNLYCRIA